MLPSSKLTNSGRSRSERLETSFIHSRQVVNQANFVSADDSGMVDISKLQHMIFESFSQYDYLHPTEKCNLYVRASCVCMSSQAHFNTDVSFNFEKGFSKPIQSFFKLLLDGTGCNEYFHIEVEISLWKQFCGKGLSKASSFLIVPTNFTLQVI